MFFDRNGNLVYLVSDVFTGSAPPADPAISPADAGVRARDGLLVYLGRVSDSDAFPAGDFAAKGELGYRLLRGKVKLVYRYEISLDENAGDFEIFVDAQTGSAKVMSISRN